jgi:hypothetical protein
MHITEIDNIPEDTLNTSCSALVITAERDKIYFRLENTDIAVYPPNTLFSSYPFIRTVDHLHHFEPYSGAFPYEFIGLNMLDQLILPTLHPETAIGPAEYELYSLTIVVGDRGQLTRNLRTYSTPPITLADYLNIIDPPSPDECEV